MDFKGNRTRVKSHSMDFHPCKDADAAFKLDHAWFDIISQATSDLSVWYQTTECYKCDLIPCGHIAAGNKLSLQIQTTFSSIFYFKNKSLNSTFCHKQFQFVENGQYGLNVTNGNCSEVYTVEEPPYPYKPLLIMFILFAVLSVVWAVGRCVCHSEWLRRAWPSNVPFSELESDLGSPVPVEGVALVRSELLPLRRQRSRVKSLDTFRGICIALMIFVNYGGGKYWFFKHSPWNGLTIADLVFPWFMWIMGFSIALSMRSQLRSCLPRRRLLSRVLWRSLLLVALGVALNTAGCGRQALSELRLPGVLQRLGITYLLVASLETLMMKPQGSFQYGRWQGVQDLLEGWVQWLVVVGLAGAQVGLTLLLEVPGCPRAYLGPGGLQGGSAAPNCTGGAAAYVDHLLLGEPHLYQRPSPRAVYATTVPFDPEGVLGTLTSVLIVFLGVQAGRILLCFHYSMQRTARWATWAILTGLIAGGLCGFSKEDGVLPVNKNLTSLSFVLALASMAFLAMAALYVVVDVKQWWGGAPFCFAGMNPIVLYVGHELTRSMFPWSWQPMYGTHAEFLAMNAWGTSLWLIIAYVLFRKNVFISL